MHKVLERASVRGRLSGASCADVLEALCGGECGLAHAVCIGRFPVGEVLAALGARLHRPLTSGGTLAVARLLVELIPPARDAVLHLVMTFPDLLIPVTQIIVARGRDDGGFILEGLEQWSVGLFSSRKSQMELRRYIAGLLAYAARTSDGERRAVQLACTFIQSLDAADEALASVEIALELCSALVQSGFVGNLELGIVLVDFAYRVKQADPSMDCTLLVEAVGRLHCPTTAQMVLTISHPVFNEAEFISALNLVQKEEGNVYTKTAALFALADYPYLSLEDEAIVDRVLALKHVPVLQHGPCDASGSEYGTKERFMLLMGVVAQNDVRIVPPYIDFDYAYAMFVSLAVRFVESPGSSSCQHLAQMAEIAKAHPQLAQRLLLLLSLALKDCKSRAGILAIAQSLLATSLIDDFCRERAVALLQALVRSSYALRAALLPRLAASLRTHPFLANLLSENLASLVYSSDANRVGAAAFAMSIWHLVNAGARQSYLNLAFTSIQGVLRAKEKMTIRDINPKTLALLVESLDALVQAQYISPKLVWNELVKPLLLSDEEAMRDADYCATVYRLAASVAALVPDAEEDYPGTDPSVMDAIGFLQRQLDGDRPAGALCALVRFPSSFLSFCQIDLMATFPSVIDSPDFDGGRLEEFLTTWLGDEVKSMPRSLFLGTSTASVKTAAKSADSGLLAGALKSRLATWSSSSSALLSVIKGAAQEQKSVADLEATLSQLTTLPSLQMQNWILRLDFVSLLKDWIYSVLSAVHAEAEFNAAVSRLMGAAEERMRGQSVSSITYAMITWAAVAASATAIDDNQARALSALKALLAGSLVEERFAKNEEALAIQGMAVKMVLDVLDETSGRAVSGEIEAFINVNRGAPANSWLWLTWQLSFGTQWPRLLRNPEEIDRPKAEASSLEELQTCLLMARMTPDTFASYQQAVAAMVKSEPAALAGMLNYGLGAAARRTLPVPTDWIRGILAGLMAPGPAIKKMENCYALAGLLGLVDVHTGNIPLREEIGGALAKAEAADARLQTWLVALLAKCQSLASPTTRQSRHAGTPNRFGEASPFGVCVARLVDRACGERAEAMIVNALAALNVLPRMDWSFLDAARAAELAWRHFQSVQGEQVHVNRSLVRIAVESLVDGHASLVGRSGQVQSLVSAIGDDQDMLEKLVGALDRDCRHDDGLIPALLHSDLSKVGKDRISALLCSLPSKTLATWRALAEMDYTDPDAGLLIKFLKNGELDDALAAVYQRPEHLSIIAECLASSKTILLDLATCYVLCAEDAPADLSLIGALMAWILATRAHPMLKDLSDERGLLLAWLEFSGREPNVARKISRRMIKATSHLEGDDPMLCVLGIVS